MVAPGRVGVIGSVTRPFCGSCYRVLVDRRRAGPQLPVRHHRDRPAQPARTGAPDGQLAAAWRGAVAAKLPGHGISDPGSLAARPGPCPPSAADAADGTGYAPRASRNRIEADICPRRHAIKMRSIPSAAPSRSSSASGDHGELVALRKMRAGSS